MIKPTVRLRVNTGKLKALADKMTHAGGYTTVGVHEDAGKYKSGIPVALVAVFHEFGAPAAHVPERSFIRSSMRDNWQLINKWRALVLKRMLEKGWTNKKALTALGLWVTEVVRNRIISGVPPPLQEHTIRSKQRRVFGLWVTEVVRNRIISGVPPPLQERTIRSKQRRGLAPKEGAGGAKYPAVKPLIDTTLLLRSIKSKVVSGREQPKEG